MISTYLCYFFGADHGIAKRQQVQANNDEDAVAKARALAQEYELHTFELWEGLRQVHKETEDANHR